MSFLSTLLILYLHILIVEHSSVQCAFLGKRLGWKAEYTCTKNVNNSAWITSPPQYPSPTPPLLTSAYPTSPSMLLDPISREEQQPFTYSDYVVASAEAATTVTDGALSVVPSNPSSLSPIREPDPTITLPPTAYESFLALQLPSTAFESFLALQSSAAPDCNPIPCEIIYNVSHCQPTLMNVYLMKRRPLIFYTLPTVVKTQHAYPPLEVSRQPQILFNRPHPLNYNPRRYL